MHKKSIITVLNESKPTRVHDAKLSDVAVDPNADIERLLELDELRSIFHSKYTRLTDFEKAILVLRYGLPVRMLPHAFDEMKHKLDQDGSMDIRSIARAFKITQDDVERTREKAINKIRKAIIESWRPHHSEISDEMTNDQKMAMGIDVLGLTPSANESLEELGIETIGDLCAHSPNIIYQLLRNYHDDDTKRAIGSIPRKLERMGLSFKGSTAEYDKNLDLDISVLNLPRRVNDILYRRYIITIEDLTRLTTEDLLELCDEEYIRGQIKTEVLQKINSGLSKLGFKLSNI